MTLQFNIILLTTGVVDESLASLPVANANVLPYLTDALPFVLLIIPVITLYISHRSQTPNESFLIL